MILPSSRPLHYKWLSGIIKHAENGTEALSIPRTPSVTECAVNNPRVSGVESAFDYSFRQVVPSRNWTFLVI